MGETLLAGHYPNFSYPLHKLWPHCRHTLWHPPQPSPGGRHHPWGAGGAKRAFSKIDLSIDCGRVTRFWLFLDTSEHACLVFLYYIFFDILFKPHRRHQDLIEGRHRCYNFHHKTQSWTSSNTYGHNSSRHSKQNSVGVQNYLETFKKSGKISLQTVSTLWFAPCLNVV